jgi:uncharacterized membrane protein YhaH (DUF805 family)
MKKRQKFLQEVFFLFLTTPFLINAIIKSFLIIPTDNTKLQIYFFSIELSKYTISILTTTLSQLTMLFGLASLIILIINIAIIAKSTEDTNTEEIGNWAKFTIKICALSNISIIGLLNHAKAIQTNIKPNLTLWIITLLISIIFPKIKSTLKNNNS